MTAHTLVEVIDLGWQATGYSTPSVYRVDGRCSCGYIATMTAGFGEEAARKGLDGLHRRHVLFAELEDRIVARFTERPLGPASSLILTEQAARRFAALAIEEFLHPPDSARQ